MYTAIELDAEPKKDMRIHNFNWGDSCSRSSGA